MHAPRQGLTTTVPVPPYRLAGGRRLVRATDIPAPECRRTVNHSARSATLTPSQHRLTSQTDMWKLRREHTHDDVLGRSAGRFHGGLACSIAAKATQFISQSIIFPCMARQVAAQSQGSNGNGPSPSYHRHPLTLEWGASRKDGKEGKSGGQAARQPVSQSASQPNSRAAEQPNSQTAKQPNGRTKAGTEGRLSLGVTRSGSGGRLCAELRSPPAPRPQTRQQPSAAGNNCPSPCLARGNRPTGPISSCRPRLRLPPEISLNVVVRTHVRRVLTLHWDGFGFHGQWRALFRPHVYL